MKKPKLGIVNSSPPTTSYGGVGPFIKNLDPFLREHFEVHYINLPPALHDLKDIPRRLTFLLYLAFKRKIFKNYDAILSHVPEGSYIISFSQTPLIHIFHGNFNAMTQSRFWYGKYFQYVFDSFEKRILKKSKLKYTVGNERADVPKILNPIFHSVIVKPTDHRSGFIFGGRLEKIKNIDKIIKIYSLLDKSITDSNLLYIAGAGTQESYLKQLASELNLKDKVVFTGELANHELIELVSKRKISLLASLQEGLPMAIAESLSVGVPVVTTNTGDISRAIKSDYNGYILPIEFAFNEYILKISSILLNYEVFARNALSSSEIFRAENVAGNLINDIKKVIDNE